MPERSYRKSTFLHVEENKILYILIKARIDFAKRVPSRAVSISSRAVRVFLALLL